jgi:hypothetical protein
MHAASRGAATPQAHSRRASKSWWPGPGAGMDPLAVAGGNWAGQDRAYRDLCQTGLEQENKKKIVVSYHSKV